MSNEKQGPTMEQMLADLERACAYADGSVPDARAKVLVRFAELERERDEALRESTLLTRKILTCGVAASHPNPELSRRAKDYGGPWDSPQAEEVRKLRAERDAYKADAEQLRSSVIEECAKVCETVRAAHPDYATPHYYQGTEECAEAIRALKEREAGQ